MSHHPAYKRLSGSLSSVILSRATGFPFVSLKEGLSISKTEKTVAIHANKEGFYEDVYLFVTDSEGIEYESDRISFMADYSAPSLAILSPKNHEWLQDTVSLVFHKHLILL